MPDLAEILESLNHNPESFAKVIGRNPSGFRRIVNGDVTPSSTMVADILTGLYAEGYQGEPGHVRQLKGGLRGSMWNRQWWIDRRPPEYERSTASGRPRQGVEQPRGPQTTAFARLQDPIGYRMKKIFDLAAQSLGA